MVYAAMRLSATTDRVDVELKSTKSKAVVITALNAGMGTKDWAVRAIPMNDILTMTLKEVIQSDSSDSPQVLTGNRGDIKSGFKKGVKVVGLGGFRFHGLLHSWCSRLGDTAWIGHRS